MRISHTFSGWRRQQGQALIYGVFVLIAGLAALFFLFNAGQLSREKTKLVIAADAAAYSAGVIHARTLNYQAYTNRAMVANTVSIAQLVSLASWVRYVDSAATSPSVSSIGNPTKYPAFYPSYLAIQLEGQMQKAALIDFSALENLAIAADNIIRRSLMTAQLAAHQALPEVRTRAMEDVVAANYRNDGTVRVEPLPASMGAFEAFSRAYSGDERMRFAQVAETAAKRDGFQRRRSWHEAAIYPECTGAFLRGQTDWLARRGGTELLGLDEWKAVDTLSEWQWKKRNKWDLFCTGLVEAPAGRGSQSAAEDSSLDLNPSHYDRSLIVNPVATTLAMTMSSDEWKYSGIPNFYDLTPNALAVDDPRLSFAIRLRRPIDQTVTSEGRSAVRQSDRLNSYRATPAGGNDLVAISVSEVFFERPNVAVDACSDGGVIGNDNCYGRTTLGRRRETGSLFNPYWQVRLVNDSAAVAEARALQGAGL